MDFNEEFNYKNEDNKDNKIEGKNNKNEEEENEKLRKKYENEKKIIKRLNDDLDEITDKSKSFENN